jgi:hypothetical protein
MDRLSPSDKRRFMKRAGTNVAARRTVKKDCIEDFIKSIPVFLHLSDEALGEVRKHLYKKQYGKGKKVFEKGVWIKALLTTWSADFRSFPPPCFAVFRAGYRATPTLSKRSLLPAHQAVWRTFFYDIELMTTRGTPCARFPRKRSPRWQEPVVRPFSER